MQPRRLIVVEEKIQEVGARVELEVAGTYPAATTWVAHASRWSVCLSHEDVLSYSRVQRLARTSHRTRVGQENLAAWKGLKLTQKTVLLADALHWPPLPVVGVGVRVMQNEEGLCADRTLRKLWVLGSKHVTFSVPRPVCQNGKAPYES